MKKIVYVISTLKKTGPTLVLFNIIKNLDINKFKPVILTLSPEPADTMIEEFKKHNIEIICINLGRITGFLFAGFKIKKIIKDINPDIIHSHCFRSALFSGFFLSEHKRVSTVHCDYKTDFLMAYGKITGYIMYLLMHFSLKKISNNICCSKVLADLLNARYKSINFEYIDNGIDIEKFSPSKDKQALRETLSLPLDKKIFIWIGAFIERKNCETLAKAINNLNTKDIFFIFCGKGESETNCKQLLYGKENVLFAGSVNNVNEYLKASDYYISTSFSEGLPNSVLEAMSCGLPAILSNIPQHKYILNNDYNFYFEPDDVNELSDKITLILKENYEKHSHKSINIAKTRFSAAGMSEKYSEYYTNLINKSI